ncbi:MAG: hypothetical protein IJ748_04810 [Bacteroidales bacterium]|nr:hypothetical protein [Bacteroidales bacterium]
MKTKNILFILMSVISLASAYNTSAWNFYAENNDGVRIYYNIISSDNHTVEVTYGSEAYNSYSGNVVIPSVVEYDGQEYTVIRIGYNAFLRSSGLTGI